MQRLPGRLARPVARALFLLVLPAAGRVRAARQRAVAARLAHRDAQGRAWYRLRSINNELITNSLEQSLGSSDVYRVQFRLRYSF